MTHENVQAAMVAILAEMPAVGKNQRAPQVMGGYAFRGIDGVLNVLNPLLAKHGVFYVPTVRERIDGSYTYSKDGKDRTMWTVKLCVQYTFHGPGADKIAAVVWGEAHDSGDKATQKALTAAQKSMLFQVFAINTADQADSDSDRHEAEQATSERPYLSALNIQAFNAKCAEVGLTAKEIDELVFQATSGRTEDTRKVFADEVSVLRAAFESWVEQRAQKAAPSAISVPPGEDKVAKKVPKRPLAESSGVENVETGTLV